MKTEGRSQVVGRKILNSRPHPRGHSPLGGEDFAAADRMRWLGKMNRPCIVRAARRGEFYFPLFYRRRSPEDDRGIPLSRAQLMGGMLILLPGAIAGAAWLLSALGWVP